MGSGKACAAGRTGGRLQDMKGDPQLARRLWAVGDEVRIRLLRLLPAGPDCTRASNVSGLAAALGLAQPTVSHHLRILRQAGIVKQRRMCRDVYHWVDRDAAGALVANLESVLLEIPETAGDGAAEAIIAAPAPPKARRVQRKVPKMTQPSPKAPRT